jgi:hypothetical protein
MLIYWNMVCITTKERMNVMTSYAMRELDFENVRVLPARAAPPPARQFLRGSPGLGAVWQQRVQAPDGSLHWIADSVFGRELLVERLRQRRPDLGIPPFQAYEGDMGLLETMVDDLGLRNMPAPAGWRQRLAATRMLLALHWRITCDPGSPWPPSDLWLDDQEDAHV